MINDYSIKELELTLTDMHINASFVVDCHFWETKYKGVYITDYNLDWTDKQTLEEANLLKDKGLLTLFRSGRNGKSERFSGTMLTDVDLDIMKKEISVFANSIK